MMMMMQGPPDLSEFDKLLKAWGVAFDTKNVAGDISRARRVQFGGGPRASVTEYVLWLGLDRRNLDERDVLAGGIERLNFASAGFLEKAPDATTQFAPIIRTTRDAMQIPAESVSMMPDAVGLLRNYKRGGKPLVLAARISGDAKSAFPDGTPPPAPEAKAEADKAKASAPGAGCRAGQESGGCSSASGQAGCSRQGQRRRRRRHRLPERPVLGRGARVPGPAGGDPERPQRRVRAGRAGEPLRVRRADLAARPRHQRPAVRAGRRAAARCRGALPQQGAGADRPG